MHLRRVERQRFQADGQELRELWQGRAELANSSIAFKGILPCHAVLLVLVQELSIHLCGCHHAWPVDRLSTRQAQQLGKFWAQRGCLGKI